MAGRRCLQLEDLPQEILLHIISYLRPHETVNLQLTCRCFLHLCRDPGQWRLRCFEDSSFLDDIKRRQTQALVLYGQAPRQQQQEPPPSPPPTPPPPLSLAATSGRRERARILANWDPSYEGERVSWYDEYIHRYGPISVNWFQVPNDRASWDPRRYVDVRGVALYRPDGPDGRLLAVCPLDDGSVCLWNVKGSGARKGEIVQRSDEAILFAHGPDVDNTARLRRVDSGVTECISVDSKRHRAYVAVQSRLMEVDLQQLRVVGCEAFPWSITALSEASPDVPLTVGTSVAVHLHDTRARGRMQANDIERVEEEEWMDIGTFNERSLKFLFDDKPLPPEARLPAGLHSILHYPDYGTQGGVSNDIFAVGRFPTILHYDRRMFPKLSSTVYSGARLCGLTSLPYRFSSSIAESRRKGLLSIDAIAQSRELLRGRTLVTCGEYNTKGSLELYGLDNTDVGTLDVPRRVGDDPAVHMRNRQTASGSKILSVVNHGTRIAFSDGSGYIKWVERDGFTEVRRIRIGNRQRESVANMFAEGNWASQGLGDLARKLLPINLEGGGTEAEQHRANEKDLLFWTGEALGYVAFAPRQAFSWEDFMGHDAWRTPEEQRQEEERTKYHERMIRALYRQADEAMLLRLRHEADG